MVRVGFGGVKREKYHESAPFRPLHRRPHLHRDVSHPYLFSGEAAEEGRDEGAPTAAAAEESVTGFTIHR